MAKRIGVIKTPYHQQGVVLIVALITLLLISIVGVGIMTTVNLEEKMTATAVDHQWAFQAAESALREGEQAASDAYPDFDLDTAPIHDDVSLKAGNKVSEEKTSNTVTANYLVEPIAVYRTSLEAGTATNMSGLLVRVTAHSDGLSGKANVELQSTYLIDN